MARLQGSILVAAGALVLSALATAPASGDESNTAFWDLNEVAAEGEAGPPTAFDSNGDNDGKNYDIVGTGQGYEFNGTSSRVVVPTDPSLNPGTNNFSYGVTLVMPAPPVIRKDTDDILRKGITSSPGGEFKLEIKNVNDLGKARCLVKDSLKVVAAIQAPQNVSDGELHTIVCRKSSTGVSIQVDDYAVRTKTVTKLGSVSNGNNLGLGSKAEGTARTGWDWFTGTMFDAWLRIEPSL